MDAVALKINASETKNNIIHLATGISAREKPKKTFDPFLDFCAREGEKAGLVSVEVGHGTKIAGIKRKYVREELSCLSLPELYDLILDIGSVIEQKVDKVDAYGRT